MAYLLVSVLFAPIIFFALRKKKWYLYLLMAFVAILPEQFSISLHDKLPLISASRILIVIAAAFWFFQRLKERNFKPPVAILVFLGINLLISLVHLPADIDEIKRIFLFVMERAMVVVILVDMITSREEFDCCVDFFIAGSCTLAIMGIGQTVFDYNIASALHFRETVTSFILSDRMGLTRAYATMNAISYGCYCAFMVLPIYYRLQGTGKQRYSVAFALNFVALIATFSRSAWLCIAAIAVLVFLTRPLKMLRSLWPSAVLIVVLCFGLGLVQPKFGSALVETAKSSYNTVIGVLPEEWFYKEDVTLQQTDPPVTTVPPVTEPPVTTVSPTTKPPVTTAPATTEPPITTAPPATEPPVTTAPPATDPMEQGPPTVDLSEEFGENASDPAYSRLFQWSAVEYMIQDGNFLLGYGYNALLQGQLHFSHKSWGEGYAVTTFLDVGLVGIIGESGLIGFLSYLGLLGYMLIQSIRKRTRTDTFDFYKVTIFTVPLYLLLNFLAAFINGGAVWLVFGLFFAYELLDKKGLLGETPTQPKKKWEF